ncbi:WAS/WASL-interacting protein family member 3-like isoform X1 [Triticum urartu]|uniref:WAS/WASL-interacting protein family member 3-like isoform X1 n=1 Tax=Triticum urartu TaxID=4572 RepID=UPI002043433C|nr:WAS/WASL-interacting protein family member 3-like isoform X1 [Triticum urartu]
MSPPPPLASPPPSPWPLPPSSTCPMEHPRAAPVQWLGKEYSRLPPVPPPPSCRRHGHGLTGARLPRHGQPPVKKLAVPTNAPVPVGCSELLSSLPSIVGSTHLQMKVIDG